MATHNPPSSAVGSPGAGNPAGPAVAVCTFALQQQSGAIQIFPAGTFDVPRGAMAGSGPWTLDETSAAALIAATAQRKNPLVVDYEHQTLLTAQNGQPAPAAGWVEPTVLEWRGAAGLWAAAVQWTERALGMIAAGEYKFLSPVFRYDPKTGRPLELLSVALTNNPAIDGMAAVAAATAALSLPTDPEPSMHQALRDLLGLKTATPSDDDIAAATAALKDKLAQVDALNTQVAALKAQAPDPAQYAPVAAMQALQTEVAALRADHLARQVDDLVEPALSDGRLLPVQENWARGLGKKDLAELQAYVDSAPKIGALKGSQTAGKGPGGAAPATGDATAIAALASKYQADQLAAGNPVDDVTAVLHVTQGNRG